MPDLRGYAALEAAFGQAGVYSEIESILHWDAATHMPLAAAKVRGEQLATIKMLAHDILTGPALGGYLAQAQSDTTLGDWQRANLREMERLVAHATAVPSDLVAALAKAASACEAVWRSARKNDDFKAVLADFSHLVDLTRQAAQAKAAAFGCGTYDALIDRWEPGMRVVDIDDLFADLETFLSGFIPQVMEAQAARPPPLTPSGPFPIDHQRRLATELMTAAGFDFKRGSLDDSLHPFCGGGSDDVRITVRYDENDFTQAIMAVLHETGHALYEMGLPNQWRRQPVGSARGMSLHESQSLSVEMQACRSRQFMDFLAPLAGNLFGQDGPAWSAANFYRLATRVQPSAIRVDADEVTYPAHVILRYQLEKAILSGDLPPADLPIAWRDGMKRLVGYRPTNDQEGCLQDIHWYEGLWGYFPTYVLGAMTAAQLFQAACHDQPDLMTKLGRGDFTDLTNWMRTHIHVWGSRYSSADLMVRATGRPLDAESYKRHLTHRYLHDGQNNAG